MGKLRQNSVDIALALLAALAGGDGPVAPAAVARTQGFSRASMARVVAGLAAGGVVTASRGRVAVGPIGERLLRRPGQPWDIPARQSAVSPPASGPLRLAAPPVLRRRGRFRIGFANASMDNLWRVGLMHSVEHAASDAAARIDWFAVRQADDDAARQAGQIAELLDAGVDGLLVSAADREASGAAVAAAMARGVPTVLVDRPVAVRFEPTSRVTGDDGTLGRTMARWLVETLGGKGRIVLLAGLEEAEPARRRLAAALELFDAEPGIEVLEIDWTSWRREQGFSAMASAIARHGRDISGVWCDSGLQGTGSLQAFVAAGFRPGSIPPHTGGDLNLAYKLAIRHKVRLAGVDYPPQMGTRAMETLLSALSGRWVERDIAVPSTVTVTRGHATRSVRPDQWADQHVRWDLPDDLMLGAGLGAAYNPRRFRIHYPGNRYNRSAAGARP